ncbi:hypothetical protein JTB14_007739 [Gonioctena quinquepunctata]|nr:hypothetical protein JTB14_007739 [Gonioctena quinquepunctata]
MDYQKYTNHLILYALLNTPHFLEKLDELQIQDGDLLVSFDVESLFTNVPIDKTLEIVKKRLENDTSLKTRTKLDVSAIIELLKLCTEKTYFQFKNEFYQQEFGMAMGSPLSPILSNTCMEYFEESSVETFHNGPKIWWRYVDDVFAIWNRSEEELNILLDHINSQEPTIKFTLESEQNNQLPFLDVMIQKSSSRMETSVHRKKTIPIDIYYNSNHHASVKKGIVKCLYNRAQTVCNSN